VFENKIKFKANKKYVDTHKNYLPIPAKLNIPKWFKNLEHTKEKKTIKGCIPFLDSLTAGYILKMPVDYHLVHNVEIDGEKKTGMQSPLNRYVNTPIHKEINLNYGQPEFHNTSQLGESPMVEKNKKLAVHKILNPWLIETPPGYSTLFVPPLNNTDDRFSIIPAIVDTDTFQGEINFPFIVNGDKYEKLESTIELGTPYVQVIPFRREAWKMEVVTQSEDKREMANLFYEKFMIHNYKKQIWNKKTWK